LTLNNFFFITNYIAFFTSQFKQLYLRNRSELDRCSYEILCTMADTIISQNIGFLPESPCILPPFLHSHGLFRYNFSFFKKEQWNSEYAAFHQC